MNLVMSKKSGKKMGRSMLLALISLNMIVALPPAGAAFIFSREHQGEAAAGRVMQAWTDGEVLAGCHFLIPKAGQDEIAVSLKRSLEPTPLVKCRILLAVDSPQISSGDDYFQANDLQFNIPRLVFRQPVSEHSSEG